MSVALRILLLGPPLILSGDQALTLSRRGLRSLLYYLACQSEPLPRDQLGWMLWDELSEPQMRKNLRELLSRLRTELPDPSLLQVTNEYVQLDPRRAGSDLRDFLTQYEQIARLVTRIPASSPLPDGVRALIQSALGLWRARRFQPGADWGATVELETWNRQLATRLNKARQDLLARLAEHENLVDNREAAIAYLRDALEVEPLDDLLNLRLITTLEQSGRLSEAGAACRNARELYEHAELEFPVDLAQVCQRLTRRAAQEQSADAGEMVRSLKLPLIGRDKELETLRAAFARHAPVVVMGEIGSGKSRLLHELAAGWNPAVRVMRAAARPNSSGAPLLPFAEMLRGALSVAEWRGLPKTCLSSLALLLPELETLVADLPPPPHGSILSQHLLFDGLYQVLRLSAPPEAPLLLELDNAQWCDQTTLDALQYLLDRQLFEQTALLALAVREEELTPALEKFLLRLERETSSVLLHLSPLGEEPIRRISTLVFDREISKDTVTQLRRETGGNALHVLETLRMMLAYSDEMLAEALGGHMPLAHSVYALVRERLRRLGPEAHTALSLAAAAGNEFSLELIEKAGGFSAEEMVELAEEIEQAQLIQPAAEAYPEPVYRFVQDQVREILLLDMSAARRRFSHLRIAEALKDQDSATPGAQAAILAQFYQQAGESKQAVSYWLRAAKYALGLFSLAEAERAFEQAEKLVVQAENKIDHAQLFELYSGWIDLSLLQGSAAKARRAGETLYRLGWRRERPELTSTGLLGQAAAADLEQDSETGLALLESALPFLEARGDLTGWMLYYFRRSSLLTLAGRMTKAIQELETALDEGSEIGGEPRALALRASCEYRLAGLWMRGGWPEKSFQAAEKSLFDSRQAMDQVGSAHALSAMSTANFYLGNFAAAEEQNEIALKMFLPMQNPEFICRGLANTAQREMILGRLDSAWEQTDEALKVETNPERARVYRVKADALRLLGAPQEAIGLYHKALSVKSHPFISLGVLYRLGLALAAAGQEPAGLEAIDECVDRCRREGIEIHLIPALAARALVLLSLQRSEEALRLAEQVAAEAVSRRLPYLRSIPLAMLAHQAVQEQRLDDARQKALALAHHARAIQNPFMEISGLAMLLHTEAPPPAARARLDELLAELERNTRHPVFQPHIARFSAWHRAIPEKIDGPRPGRFAFS